MTAGDTLSPTRVSTAFRKAVRSAGESEPSVAVLGRKGLASPIAEKALRNMST